VAIVTNTFTTYDAIGIREELSDVIYSVTPEKVPLLSMIGKSGAENTLFEWQTDSLAATDATNAHLEADDIASFTAVSPTVRVGNRQQISRKTMVIGGTEEKVNKAGRKSEINYQTIKRGKELKRDIESIVFAAQGAVAGNATTARKTAALSAWLKTNTDFGATGADPVYTSGVPAAARTDGTLRAFTETILKSVIQDMWTNGAEMHFMFVGPVNKQRASGFAGIATRNYDLSGTPRSTAIIASADVYVSDFGTLQIMPSRWQRERDAFLVDPGFLSIRHLRPFKREELAKTGDAKKFLLLTEWGLRVDNEEALGAAYDLTTT